MRKLISYYFLLLISICTFSYIKVNSYSYSLKGKTIYLDPGHGRVDNGTSYKEILEDELNLEICYELKSKLENRGAIVYMTRYDDYDLSNNDVSFRKKSDLYNRAKIINDSNSDMYISIHLNYIDSSKWSGVQVFYDDINSNNEIIAKNIQDKYNNGRKSMKINNGYMYRLITIPGVLVELGFLSNSKDRAILLNDRKRSNMIDKLVDGIIEYYK